VNRAELVRGQLQGLSRVVGEAEVRKAGEALDRKIADFEMTLIDLRLTGAQDGIRYAAKLVSRFGYLANGLSNADFAPTNQHLEVQKLLAERVRAASSQFDTLIDKDLAAFNEMLRARNVPNVIAGR
jgi:hypothetical protein